MSLLKRLSNVIRSNVNDAIEKAEDPKKILDQTILDMEGQLKKSKKSLIEQLTSQKQAEKAAEKLQAQSSEWESKAMAALKGGNEELARTALSEKQKIDDLVPDAQQGAMQQKKATDDLKVAVSELERKIKEARGKRDELVARINAAEMKQKQAAMQNGAAAGTDAVSDSTAFDTFDRMVEKIENTEAEVEARHEMLGDASPEVDAELDKLNKESQGDAALEALKAKMSGGAEEKPAAPAAPAEDASKAEAIDDELAALRAKLEGDDS